MNEYQEGMAYGWNEGREHERKCHAARGGNVVGFQAELDALITRWSHESDITVAEVIGCLEIAKTTELIRIHAPGIKDLVQL